jgi:hypothetical protein
VRFRITISNLQSQVTLVVRNYIAENDQYCLGSTDDGPNSQKATGYIGIDCWTYGITSKGPAGAITMYSFLLLRCLEATLQSVCVRMTNVGIILELTVCSTRLGIAFTVELLLTLSGVTPRRYVNNLLTN